MTSSPILLVGGATPSAPGQNVDGSATNNTQTDSYSIYGYNNQITENGGNLGVVTQAPPIGWGLGLDYAPQTTVNLGNASGVADAIDLYGFKEVIQQLAGTALTGGSSVSISIEENFQGFDTVDVVNPGGRNTVQLYQTPNETVTLVGGSNTVTAGSFSTIALNGDGANSIQTGSSIVTVGAKNDGLFGDTTQALLGGAGNSFTAGDEIIFINGYLSPGGNRITLGDGNDSLQLTGTNNSITVGGGNDTIAAGNGADTVSILGFDSRSATKAPGAGQTDGGKVPTSPTDTITLAGGSNTVTATYENVTVAGGSTTGGSTVTLGNGGNDVTLGGDANTVEVGDNANTISLSGNANLVTVDDTRGRGFDTVALNTGTGDVIGLGSAGASITGTGTGSTTVSQSTGSKAAVSVDLGAGAGAITLGDGRNVVTADGVGTSITAGNGQNTITALGGSLSVFDTVQVGDGKNAVSVGSDAIVSLGAGHDTVTGGSHVDVNMGAGKSSVTVADDANIRLLNGDATISVGDQSYVGPGIFVATAGHANGNLTVTTGAASDVELGNGNDAVTAGANSVVNVGAGHDTVTLGDASSFEALGSPNSTATVTLANDDVVGAVNGKVHVSGGTNATVYLDGAQAGSTISFTDKDDALYLGLNASARVFLNPAGGDLVSVQAPDSTGSYTGTVNVSGFSASDVFYLAGLYGGTVAEPLQSFGAVLDNVSKAGGAEVLALQGGGKIVFAGSPPLQSSEFHFLNQSGAVVPGGL